MNISEMIYSVVLAAASLTSSADVTVIDGDTLKLNGESNRLTAIDAPERGQDWVLANGAAYETAATKRLRP